MEKLQLFVYFCFLILFGGETAGTTYFTVQSQRWSSYFSTHHMDEDARQGYRIFIFLYYLAVISSITFITLALFPYFSGVQTPRLETARKRPNICYSLLGIATATLFLTFQLFIALRMKKQLYLFNKAGVRDYARQYYALFAFILILQAYLALLTLITFAILFRGFLRQLAKQKCLELRAAYQDRTKLKDLVLKPLWIS